jgi:kanamycin kinase/aminoglycoside 3'-phosphotransferase-3
MIADKLAQARYNIDSGIVNANDFNPETFTAEGFSDVEGLFGDIDRTRPAEDAVFSHGDFCLPNIFVSGSETTGFLDWGNGGAAARWQDIALCVRSLRLNSIEFGGYGENEYAGYVSLFFRELGIEPDNDRIRYFILMDELF